ncbi:hypothetical protein EV193_101216 [Herbihabitans rhizosphaerae]|uniref:Uncharacterized protein n=1 Tax=Herbihabitans rhizosphaerae TaxID=1872711 RepID=A0A4Q7L6V4_9PSEU|nr:hypothetical protein [Herbihabitans rhizosphaerae]RZS44341.1 hypothetical protein EV193_101216 [Herbihabitans rhizosphaerae]
MTGRDRWRIAGIVLASVVLAIIELMFLPLRFDGTLLPDLGGFPFPITVVLALATMGPLVYTAAEFSPTLLVAGSPLWAWLLVVLVFAIGEPGGVERAYVVIPDWRTLLLVGCAAGAGAVALGRVLGDAAVARQKEHAHGRGDH